MLRRGGPEELLQGHPTLDCLSALSVILDLANGLAEDKSLLTGAFAADLAQATGAAPSTRAEAFLAALLRHLGCTAFASAESRLAGDDIALRSRLHQGDSSRPLEAVQAVLSANEGLWARGRAVGRLISQAGELRGEWAREACGAAHLLAEQLRLGPGVVRALDEVFERWDGAGAPAGLVGEALSEVGRVAQVAHVAVVFLLAGGVEAARGVLRDRAGTQLEPRLVDAAVALLGRLESGPEAYLAARLPEVEALFVEAKGWPAAPGPTLEELAIAFGDFADLQVPSRRGHSRAVAALAERTGQRLGLDAEALGALRLAGHLHDLGQVAVPTAIWLTPRPFRASERERARSHAYFTERVLAQARPLAQVARVAGAHHERLDGSGYHRGLSESSLSRPARILAVADVLCALQEVRPHRPALSRAEAVKLAREAVAQGQLDSACVEAALELLGERSGRGASASRAGLPGPGSGEGLSERELEVLRALALGGTNKEIAQSLGISPRTVQHHTIHIYGKLGVNSRAAAALWAVRNGLLQTLSE